MTLVQDVKYKELFIDCYRPELELVKAEVYYDLGEVLLNSGQLKDAISSYRQAVALIRKSKRAG
jgi:tetratricopeptide (TPR) repeat protein